MSDRSKPQRNRQIESRTKESRVRSLLSERGFDSLIVTRRDHFAWLTCGGRAVVSYVTPTSPVDLVLTPDAKHAVGYVMDVPRTMDEELASLGYEPVALPTFGPSPDEKALDLAPGRVAADADLPGAENLDADLVALHEPLTEQEMARYRTIGRETGELLRELAEWVRPEMTERQVCGKMWELYVAAGFEGNCMFVGADERIERYRHPVPSDRCIKRSVLLAPAVSKWGLHALTSRLVVFGEPEAELRRRFDAVATMQAAMVAATHPGVHLSQLLRRCLGLFDGLGYCDQKTMHFHGGPTGYRVSYPERCQDEEAVATENMAFGWYLTLPGVKSEELVLLDGEGAHIASIDPTWPTLKVDVDGDTIPVADILVR